MSSHHDLHCHSYISDGLLSPTEVVDRAAHGGVAVLALTDHDTTDGLESAREAAIQAGISLINGVEISARWQGRTLHVLGLNIDPDNRILQNGLKNTQAERNNRAQKMTEKLQQAGFDGAEEGVRRLVQGPIQSRTHFARWLVEQGHVKNFSQAFKRFLRKGGQAYVDGEWAELAETISWIQAAGGQAVLAHPGRYQMGKARLRRLFEDFKTAKGDGVELISGRTEAQDIRRFHEWAQEFELLASLGSDFHGPGPMWQPLGKLPPLPKDCTPVWSVW